MKTASRKALAAKKIFQLGYDYAWALMGENKQGSHCETIQTKRGEHQCFESTHTVKILALVLCACVYFNDFTAAFGSAPKRIAVNQFKPVSTGSPLTSIRPVNSVTVKFRG